jgi:hypothetical protein
MRGIEIIRLDLDQSAAPTRVAPITLIFFITFSWLKLKVCKIRKLSGLRRSALFPVI